MMKPQEIRDLNPEEIERKIKESKENLFKLRVKLSTKQLEKTAELKKTRREKKSFLSLPAWCRRAVRATMARPKPRTCGYRGKGMGVLWHPQKKIL